MVDNLKVKDNQPFIAKTMLHAVTLPFSTIQIIIGRAWLAVGLLPLIEFDVDTIDWNIHHQVRMTSWLLNPSVELV